jgi:hypothetical protein
MGGVAPDFHQGLEAILLRHHHIDNYHIDGLLTADARTFIATGDCDDLEASLREGPAKDRAHFRVVVDDEDSSVQD